MLIMEEYNVLDHKAFIKMESLDGSNRKFDYEISIDNNAAYSIGVAFKKEDDINPVTPFETIIEVSYEYVNHPVVTDFLNSKNFVTEQEKNGGEITFNAFKDCHEWVSQNFTKKECEYLYRMIDIKADVDKIPDNLFTNQKKVFTKTFGKYADENPKETGDYDNFFEKD